MWHLNVQYGYKYDEEELQQSKTFTIKFANVKVQQNYIHII